MLATTTATIRPSLSRRFRPTPCPYNSRRLLRFYPIHVIAVHPHPEAIAHIDAQAFFFHFINDGLNAPAGDNAVAFFQIREHLLHFPTLFLLWTKNQEVKDNNQRQE